MNEQLSREDLRRLLQNKNIEDLSYSQISLMIKNEEKISESIPDGVCQIDPRNGDRIIYSSARSLRPHDTRPVKEQCSVNNHKNCLICRGETTGIVDVAELSQGFTFINKNLFPMLYPESYYKNDLENLEMFPFSSKGQSAIGFHFLQWTSSLHNKDWHNITLADRIVVMNRLAALEERLITSAKDIIPPTELSGECHYGFVSIIKNYGHLVGGSLAHGHQQIILSSIIPKRYYNNWLFRKERGESFSAYLMTGNPPELTIRDYGKAVLLIPYFMKRPFDMLLLVKDSRKRHLHELTTEEIKAVAEGWGDAIRVILRLMPQIGREVAYNVLVNNGPGAGIYFEFLPYTQEMGGFEQLGLFLCQENPLSAAVKIRTILEVSD